MHMVVVCCVLFWLYHHFLVDSCDPFAHIVQGYFIDTGAIRVKLTLLRWNIPVSGINIMPADALAPEVTRALEYATCRVAPLEILSFSVEQNPRYDRKCEYIFIILKTIQRVKS